MFEDIEKYVKSLGDIYIDQDFIDYRNNYVLKIYPDNRTEKQFNLDSDALLLEYILLRDNIVEQPSDWRYDFSIDGIKIDAKRINSKFFNIDSQTKYRQYIESYNKKQLDYFCFFKEKYKFSRPLIVGDHQSLEIIKFAEVKSVIKNCSRSIQNDGYFYVV